MTPIAYERFRDCLRLDFHDIPFYTKEDGLIPFEEDHAREVIEFVFRNSRPEAADPRDRLFLDVAIHCSAGISRSSAVAQFLVDTLRSVDDFTSMTGIIEPNPLVYDTLKSIYESEWRR